MHLKLILFGLALTLLFSAGTAPESEVIYWSADRKLTWADFRGKPDYNYTDVSALTSSGVLHLKGCQDGRIVYKIYAYFEKQQSWVKPEALTQHHLQHEQIHFDITQLYARKLEQALDSEVFACSDGEMFEQFVQDFLQQWQKAQFHYDLYTHYSMRTEQQLEWQQKVATELSEFE